MFKALFNLFKKPVDWSGRTCHSQSFYGYEILDMKNEIAQWKGHYWFGVKPGDKQFLKMDSGKTAVFKVLDVKSVRGINDLKMVKGKFVGYEGEALEHA